MDQQSGMLNSSEEVAAFAAGQKGRMGDKLGESSFLTINDIWDTENNLTIYTHLLTICKRQNNTIRTKWRQKARF